MKEELADLAKVCIEFVREDFKKHHLAFHLRPLLKVLDYRSYTAGAQLPTAQDMTAAIAVLDAINDPAKAAGEAAVATAAAQRGWERTLAARQAGDAPAPIRLCDPAVLQQQHGAWMRAAVAAAAAVEADERARRGGNGRRRRNGAPGGNNAPGGGSQGAGGRGGGGQGAPLRNPGGRGRRGGGPVLPPLTGAEVAMERRAEQRLKQAGPPSGMSVFVKEVARQRGVSEWLELLQLVTSWPVGSVENERGFSKVKRRLRPESFNLKRERVQDWLLVEDTIRLDLNRAMLIFLRLKKRQPKALASQKPLSR